ncbi:MAG: Unknown protein [uncultured Sulfurovum sp.]|uniref:Uncharacterized protein n=1 Tax=uncultured Sulfurovum sp. TaxID=269237 RepID=A0A6S6S133_9BACT|nr:MAG: Unknown protein [uncultured Sulfurovum sp.]
MSHVKIFFLTLFLVSPITAFEINISWGDIARYIGLEGGDIEDYASQIEETASENLGVLGDLGGMCYSYDPPSLGSLYISANICSLVGNVNLKSPCASAPSIPGFKKIDKFKNTLDLKRYCENVFGSQVVFDINKIVGEIDINKNIFAVSRDGYDSVENYYTLDDARENLTMIEAIKNNNYEATYIYKSLLNASQKVPKNLDVSKMNVAYTTKEEYKTSIDEQVESFSTLHDQLDLNKFKKNCLLQFRKINKATKDIDERKKQKESLKSKLLEEYREIADKYGIYKRKQRVLLEHRDPVVNPTKEFISGYEPKHRAAIIYAVEKQKTHISKIYTEVKEEVDTLNRKVALIVDKTLYSTHEFDREKAFKEIQDLIDN